MNPFRPFQRCKPQDQYSAGERRLMHIVNQALEPHFTRLENLMTKVSDAIAAFATAQQAHNDAVTTDLTTLSGQIADLKAQIAALPAAGDITADDQAKLDALNTSAEAIQDTADSLAGRTPPTPPAATDTSNGAADQNS